MQVVTSIYPHANIMHTFSAREPRSKLKTNISPIYSTRTRSLSALSVLQASQIHARASSVVRKVLGVRSPLKEPALFDTPIEGASCDKPRSSADSTPREGNRPRSNTTPTEITWPKAVTITPANHDTLSAPSCTSGPTQTTPVNSLLFSPTPNTPPSDDQEMEPAQSSPKRPSIVQGSPEIDSGYGSGQSSAARSALPPTNNSPVIARTPRALGKAVGSPVTPGGMNMRLSPSLPRSIMPMPILNLPPLPPTPAHDHTLPRTRSFHPEEMRHVKKSMPALMRHGTSNMATTHAEEDDDEDGSSDGTDSDSSDNEGMMPDGDSSPEAHDSIDESTEESTLHSGSEGPDGDYFDAREMHAPAPSADDPSGLATPRASDQNRTLGEASALGLQITPTPGPSTINGSPWTVVDITPGVDRASSGLPPRTDYFSHPVAAARQALKTPHRTPRVSQLISLASPRAHVSSPKAAPVPLSPSNTIAARRARAATVLRDPNGESPRPALYQQVSHSMMNLSSPTHSEEMSLTGFDALRTPRESICPMTATPGTPTPSTPKLLIRRNSMPTQIRHPPGYNDLYPSVPREEEGKEGLPGYSCGIHIEAMMPRKMEFSAPGVLAKDRGWKKQYIVIHGTSLMVYKYDIRKVPIGGKIKGKDKYEGVVTEDEVDLNSPTVHLPGHESAAPRLPLNQPSRRNSRRASSTAASDNGSRSSLLSRFHGNSSRSTVSQPQETPAPDDKANANDSTVSISASNSTSSSRRWSHTQASVPFASGLPHFNPPFSSGNQLIRQYTLQRAESGLGSDYYKRRNVIRVRCEGEQFLLQAENVMQVVDWIECLQAGTNAALDLDERPMTKPPPFPRRRRRRRARPDGTNEANGNATSNHNANDNNTNR
ncbi:Pleckstrin homology domain [Rhizoctonia solani]|uniref:Pleckstrin homology domain n=1 Tax=Rhizoctonia solani TaxID=456999 RepID=A0A8H7H942_9AGAM|nr:Pleckstrin homology domain [Rhizoctonia solani]